MATRSIFWPLLFTVSVCSILPAVNETLAVLSVFIEKKRFNLFIDYQGR